MARCAADYQTARAGATHRSPAPAAGRYRDELGAMPAYRRILAGGMIRLVHVRTVALPRGRGAALGAAALAAAVAAVVLVALRHEPAPPGPAPGQALRLERAPYLGVACPEPNRIECGRVALQVVLRDPVARLEVTVAGHRMHMDDVGHGPRRAGGLQFEGAIQRPGLIRRDLGVRPDTPSGRWLGSRPAPPVELRLTGYTADGARLPTRTLGVRLAPGYG